MMHKIKIKLNQDLHGHVKDKEIYIETDEDGIALSDYWRNRLHDAKIDNCITVIEDVDHNGTKDEPLDDELEA